MTILVISHYILKWKRNTNGLVLVKFKLAGILKVKEYSVNVITNEYILYCLHECCGNNWIYSLETCNVHVCEFYILKI